jgi:AraC-like DNA-binding protein
VRCMDNRVLKVIELMRKNLRGEVSLGDLARAVNLSPSRFHQIFKNETGHPPAKYLRMLRMERARQLLETSFLSVKEIRFKVGVSDESHFVRDFKKTYGLTPTRYREEYLAGGLNGGASAKSKQPAPVGGRGGGVTTRLDPAPPPAPASASAKIHRLLFHDLVVRQKGLRAQSSNGLDRRLSNKRGRRFFSSLTPYPTVAHRPAPAVPPASKRAARRPHKRSVNRPRISWRRLFFSLRESALARTSPPGEQAGLLASVLLLLP